MGGRILIVDDEQGVREALRQVLEYEGHEVRVAGSGGEAITLYPDFRPNLVFLDVKMAGLDGLETLSRLRALDERAQVVMISGHGTVATAVQATQRGAFDFLEKPLDSDRLLVTVRNALNLSVLSTENQRFKRAPDQAHAMVGSSPAGNGSGRRALSPSPVRHRAPVARRKEHRGVAGDETRPAYQCPPLPRQGNQRPATLRRLACSEGLLGFLSIAIYGHGAVLPQ